MKKIFAMVIIFSILLLPSYADRRQELENINNELRNIKSEITQKKDNMSELNLKILRTDLEIEIIEDELSLINTRIENTKEQVRQNSKKIGEKEKEIIHFNQILKNRIRIMSKVNSIDYIKIVFSSKSIEEFLSNYSIIKKIIQQDKENLERLSISKRELSDTVQSFERLQETLGYLKNDYDKKTKSLVILKSEQSEYLSQLERDLTALLEMENIKINQANQITQEIQQQMLESNYQGNYTGGKLLHPVPNGRITSPYGYRQHPILNQRLMHTGLDIAGNMGQDILASEEGRVIYSDTKGTYGKTVMIDHGSGIVTLYAHCSQLYVSTGQVVSKGEVIAAIGSTGRSTGPHLHYEVRINGQHTDPINYLR